MLRAAENEVKIEGYLSQINLEYKNFDKNGTINEAIAGDIKVLVEQEINGELKTLEIPVNLFANKLTRKRELNPAYESIKKVKEEYISIAAAGNKEEADKVRLKGNIEINEFYNQGGTLISEPRIRASFVSKAYGEFCQQASFVLEFVVSSIARETDIDGIELEPPKLNATVISPKWTPPTETEPRIDLIKLVALNTNVINAIEGYWENGKTYKASGRLNFSTTTQEYVREVDFGEPIKDTKTFNVKEFVITGGSQVPLDETMAFDPEEIKKGLRARDFRNEEKRKNSLNRKQTVNKAPSQNSNDYGF